MSSRNTKPPKSSLRETNASKTLSVVLPAIALILGLTALEPSPVAHAAGPSVVQFSASSYSVNEGTTFKTITVTRTGDVSGPATVDYTTANISASQRTDYTAALGTLRFGANESSKSFDVLISEDIKLEGTESFSITLSNGTGQALLGSPSTTSVVITDDPIEAGPNPIDFTDIFVGQHYHDFLARQSDNPGQVFWESQISPCGNNAACIDDRRTNVSAAFFLSIEFQQTGYFVIRIYKAYGTGNTLGRAAALKSVVESDSVFDKQYNPAFVLMQYFGYLRRDPDDLPDNNFNGYDFWLNKMNQVSVTGENVRNDDVALSRVKRADMVKSFLVSGEYRGRFGL
jgi:hypothetical protein